MLSGLMRVSMKDILIIKIHNFSYLSLLRPYLDIAIDRAHEEWVFTFFPDFQPRLRGILVLCFTSEDPDIYDVKYDCSDSQTI